MCADDAPDGCLEMIDTIFTMCGFPDIEQGNYSC